MDDLNSLKKKLLTVPSLFELEKDLEKHQSKSNIDKIIHKLLNEINGHLCRTEEIRTMNLLSFLYVCVDNFPLAYDYNTQALSLDDSNIIAWSNKAWMKLKEQKDFHEIEQIIKKLDSLKKCKWELLTSDAEKAFAYSRFGMRLYEKAIEVFKVVLEKAKSIYESRQETSDQTDLKTLNENICLWSFGLALTEKRRLNVNNLHDSETIDLSREKHQEVAKLFLEITKLSGIADSECIKTYRARALIEIGFLAHNAERNKEIFPRGVADIFPGIQEQKIHARDYFKSALTICPRDSFVLERSGKYFRYNNDLHRSIQLLETALQVKKTSFAHHHLALSMKRDLEMQSTNANRYPSRYRGRGKRRGHVRRNLFENQRSVERQPTCKMNVRPNSLPAEVAPERSAGSGRQFALSCQSEDIDVTNQTYDSGFCSMEGSMMSYNQQSGSNSQELNRMTMNMQNVDPEVENLTGHTMNLQVSENQRTGLNNPGVEKQTFERHKEKQWKQGYHVQSDQCHKEPPRSFSQPNPRNRGHGGAYSRSWSTNNSSQFQNSYSQTPTMNQLSIMNLIKSPRKVTPIHINRHGSEIQTIVQHLDEAVLLSPTNYAATYDKGILYRQIGNMEEALDIFRYIIKNKDKGCSTIQLANSYEQAAYCIQSLAESRDDTEMSVLEYDIRCYLKRSIELSCIMVAKIPCLKDCWLGPPTLSNFIKQRPKTKTNLKDLAFLHKKMQNYDGAVSVLKELKELSQEDSERVDILNELVKVHSEHQRYDDAILALDLIRCLPDGYDKINEELYIFVHVEGGMEALRKGENEMARLRFKYALDFSVCKGEHDNTDTLQNKDDSSAEECGFDMFVLCETSTEDKWRVLVELLNEMGIAVTLNTDDVLPGLTELSGIASIIELSKNFIFALDSSNTKSSNPVTMYAGMIHDVLTDRSYGHRLVVSDGAHTCVPTILKGIPRIDLSLETLGVSEKWASEYVHENMKSLLTRLALHTVEPTE